jgi:hypothetical protein
MAGSMPGSWHNSPRPGDALDPDKALEPVDPFKFQVRAFDARELREEQNIELLKKETSGVR